MAFPLTPERPLGQIRTRLRAKAYRRKAPIAYAFSHFRSIAFSLNLLQQAMCQFAGLIDSALASMLHSSMGRGGSG
jgi:hypothetical protein